MPRPSAQISLDYQTRVLQPQVMTLLCWLANDGTPFWCREFEELYRAFSGWHEAFRVYDDAVRSRTLMDEEKKDKDWKEEWWSFYCNYAIKPDLSSAANGSTLLYPPFQAFTPPTNPSSSAPPSTQS
ncbi:hypothetical protein JCM10207_003597 [Rhodosporidiobolus poonsookiae]